MALRGEQLDKVSLLHCKITAAQRKEQKRQHIRKLRRIAKNVYAAVQFNRYHGWIG